MENLFLEKIFKDQENIAYTENGAVSYATTGSVLVDQFGKAGSFSGRDIESVFADQEALWNENPEAALKFPFYLRMITRKVKALGETTSTLQKGPGLRDEAFKRLVWIGKNHPEEFYRNLWILPMVGSYKDIWTLLSMMPFADESEFFNVLIDGLNHKDTKDLVLKYMPRIMSVSRCTTDRSRALNNMAKRFSKALGFSSYKDYRKFKSSGKAHVFQQIITKRKYKDLNWDEIPGKALQNLANSRFLGNHGLEESYISWMSGKGSIRFNGTPVEILAGIRRAYERKGNIGNIVNFTSDLQFKDLVNKVREEGTWDRNVLCALDTSSSMTWEIINKRGVKPIDVCLSLGIYFSELNTGKFHDVVAMFDDTSRFKRLSGTFAERYKELMNDTVYGGTDFISLVDLICRTREKYPEIPLEDFPTTLLVVSDMQFNAYGKNTNVDISRDKIAQVFPKEWADNFKFIWWNCSGRHTEDMPSTLDDGNSFFMSGYDGSILSLLTGMEDKAEKVHEKPSMEDLVDKALNQEVLLLVR